MTFAFISHAQLDKKRPDQRMRALVHFLHQAGIPLWIDRPEELGLRTIDLEERCVTLKGKWPNDIRDALNRCTTGVGFWSLHARNRVQQEANGVLAQELQTLSIAEKLHLACIDPGVVGDAALAFNNLALGQQAIDLGAVDHRVFAQRAARLLESLAAATGTKSARVRLYVKALSATGGPGAVSGFLQPDLKRAREAARALASAFEKHDPGRLAITLTPELAAAYERMAGTCKQLNRQFRTYHRMLALMQLPSRHFQSCLDEVEPGLSVRVETWFAREAEKGSETYVGTNIFADHHAEAAKVFAEMDQASAIDERHALRAMLADRASGTSKALRQSLGERRFDLLMQLAEQRRPRQPDFEASASIGNMNS
jgi:hypothetical protein